MSKVFPRLSRKKIHTEWKRYLELEIFTRAAALAYHTLLGIVPVIGLLFWYLKNMHVTDWWLELTRGFIMQQLNVASSEAFSKHFNLLTGRVQGTSWGWVGLVLLVYTVTTLVAKFGQTLDHILRAGQKDPADLVSWAILCMRRALAMLGLPLALAFSLAITQWVKKDSWIKFLFELNTVGSVMALPLAWAASIVAVFLVYFLIPRSRVPWKKALIAAAVVGPASELMRYLFGWYNSYAVSVHKIYGVLAAIPMFILWVQVSWVLLLSGAFLIRVISYSDD